MRGGLGVVIFGLAVAACGGRTIEYVDGGAGNPPPSHPFSCSSIRLCPDDPPVTERDIEQCNEQLAGACGTQVQAYGDCAVTHPVCGLDGTLDVTAVEQACEPSYLAAEECNAMLPPDDAGIIVLESGIIDSGRIFDSGTFDAGPNDAGPVDTGPGDVVDGGVHD